MLLQMAKFHSFMFNSILLYVYTCKASVCNAGDPGSIPESGRSPGEGNGNLLQYSCLENSIHRGAWRATVHGVTELDMTECARMHTSNLKMKVENWKYQLLPIVGC